MKRIGRNHTGEVKGTDTALKTKAVAEKAGKIVRTPLGMAFLKIILSIVLAVGAYFIARNSLPETYLWLREIISLAISLLVLGGFSALLEGAGKLGTAVTLLLIAIFIYQLVHGYSEKLAPGNDDQETEQQAKEKILGPGIYQIKVEPQKPTEIFQIRATNPRAHGSYSIKSETYSYQLWFDDGENIPGGEGIIKYRSKPRFRMYSETGDLVTIIVR